MLFDAYIILQFRLGQVLNLRLWQVLNPFDLPPIENELLFYFFEFSIPEFVSFLSRLEWSFLFL